MQNATRPSAQNRFELVVRLQPYRSNHPTDAGVRLRAQALVKDVLMSRLEVEAEIIAPEYVQTQGFADPGKALAASRALQAAFEGFRTAAPSGRTNVSVILDFSAPEEGAPGHAVPSVEQKDLLESAKPSQVLITQAFYDRVAGYQPPLRSSQRAGVYEFLWTSEQQLDAIQAGAELMPTLVSEPAQPAVKIDTNVDRPVAPQTASRRIEPKPPPAPPPEPVSDEAVRSTWLSGKRVAVMGGAVAILAVVGYLASSHVLVGNGTAPVVQHSVPKVNPPAAPDPGPVTTPPPSVAKPATGHIATKPPTPIVPPTAEPLTSAKPATKARGCTIDGDVSEYLRLAESNRSRGNYERAISEYTQVLGCEPGNRLAQTGLRNARDAEQLH
jgi:hypothetical protein